MAAAGDSPVTVIDIDRAVVEGAMRIAGELGSQRLSAQHSDISAESGSNVGSATIVICDPFPSADGSFEEMFWRKASAILEPGGLLITTVAPSHKPEHYAQGALSVLPRLGFQLIDLQADFGRYELFGFELAMAEIVLLRELGLTSTISHTKSLLAARYVGAMPENNSMKIDFAKWSAATQLHYLTVQAGLQEQLAIVTQRGPTRLSDTEKATDSSGYAHSSAGPSTIPVSYLEDQLADSFSNEEKNSLRELVDATNGISAHSGWLDLAVRAIESWNRLRFDAQ